MARTPAVGGASRKILRALRQQQAITGESLSPEQIRAIVAGELDVEAARSMEGARLEEIKRMNRLKEKRMEAEDRSAAITGAAQLGATAYEMFKVGPELRDIERAKIQAIRERTAAFTGKSAATTTAQAVESAVPKTTGDFLSGYSGQQATRGASTGVAETQAATTTVKPPLFTTVTAAMLGGTIGTMFGEKSNWMSDEAGGYIGSAVAGFAVGGPVGALVGLGVEAISDATVICSELHRQGYMPDNIFKLDAEFARKHITMAEYIGYRSLADPIVERMRVSRLVTMVVKPFALAWSYTMANQMDSNVKVKPIRKLVGSLILYIGRPLCRWKYARIMEGGICYG